MLRVADIMTRDVITIAPETPVEEIARLLHERRISGVPVVDAEGRVVGIVSESDLMAHVGAIGDQRPRHAWWLTLFADRAELAREYARTHGRTAADVMAREVVTITEDMPVAAAARELERRRIKRLPVVRDGKLVGIVSRANLLQALAVADVTRPAAADDRDIRAQLEAELADQPWAQGATTNIVVQDGVIHLWGYVRTEDEHRAFLAAARSIPGARGVEDHLAVHPGFPGHGYE